MIADFLAQFVIEFVRALLIDEISERVRGKVKRVRRVRRDQRRRRDHSKRGLLLIRTLSTDEKEKVK